MPDFISRNELNAALLRKQMEYSVDAELTAIIAIQEARLLLQRLPAADVAEVVRCKDCEYRYTTACLMEFTVNGKSIEWSADNRSCNIGTPKDGGENHAE